MAAANWFRYAYLAHLSRPQSSRQLYRLIKRNRVSRIVEIGISDVSRAVARIEVAQRFAEGEKVCHTGLDWFDARPPHLSPLTVKEAYRALHATGVNIRLVPGCPGRSLAGIANAHQNTDLILIASSVSDDELKAAWFYVPRMLHAESVILRECQHPGGEPSFEQLTRTQIAEWAAEASTRRAA